MGRRMQCPYCGSVETICHAHTIECDTCGASIPVEKAAAVRAAREQHPKHEQSK